MTISQISFLQLTTPAHRSYGSKALGSKYQDQEGPVPSQYYRNYLPGKSRGGAESLALALPKQGPEGLSKQSSPGAAGGRSKWFLADFPPEAESHRCSKRVLRQTCQRQDNRRYHSALLDNIEIGLQN